MQALFYVNAKNISERKLNRKLDNYTEYLGLIPCADFKQSIEAKNAQKPTNPASKNIDTTDCFNASM